MKIRMMLLAMLKGAGIWLLTIVAILFMSLCHIDGITAMPEDFGRTETFLLEDIRPLLPAMALLGLHVWLGWRRRRQTARRGDRIAMLTALLLNLLLIEFCIPFLKYSTTFAYCVIALAVACIFAPGMLLLLPGSRENEHKL